MPTGRAESEQTKTKGQTMVTIQKSTEGTLDVQALADEFREALAGTIAGVVRCGEIYAATLDESPEAAAALRSQFDGVVPQSAWRLFEAVGRKVMHPSLLLGAVPNAKKHKIIRSMPFDVQTRIFQRKRFDMLTEDGDTLKVDVLEASPEQVAQMFDDDGPRSVSAQRAFIESRRAKESEDVVDRMPYEIRRGKLVVRKGTELTRAEVQRILMEM